MGVVLKIHRVCTTEYLPSNETPRPFQSFGHPLPWYQETQKRALDRFKTSPIKTFVYAYIIHKVF